MKSMYRQYLDGEIRSKDYMDYWAVNNGYKNYNDYKYDYYNNKNNKGIHRSMSENKECSFYLGVYIAERILSKVFDNVTRMTNCNIGYDFICGKGFKVDVKSACLFYNKDGNNKYWSFNIGKNDTADYFLLLAFDNREDLNPLHIWLIKSNEIINGVMICNKINIKISLPYKFKKYEQIDKLEKLKECCNTLKDLR